MSDLELESAILAEPCTVSTRVLAKKLGCSASLVSKVRRRAQNEAGDPVRAQTRRQVEKRHITWLDRVDLLAEDVEKLLQRAAGDKGAHLSRDIIHAVCGGFKILAEAKVDLLMVKNAGGNAKTPGETGEVSEDSESTQGADVIPISRTA